MAIFTNSITGSVLGNSTGTASFAQTASIAFALANPVIGGAIISASRPSNLISGSLWWNSDDGNSYVQISGSSGSTFVPITTNVAGGTFGATFRNSYSGSTWTVLHNLGTTTPIVTVYSGSQVMIPATVTSTDVNTTTITFASSVSGSVVASTGVGGPTSSSFALSAVSATTASYLATPTICVQGDINQTVNVTTTLYSASTRLNITGSATKFSIGSFTVGATGITPNQSGFYKIEYSGWVEDNGGSATNGIFTIGVNNVEAARTQVTVNTGWYSNISFNTIHQVTAGQLIDFRLGTSGAQSLQVRDTTITLTRVG